LAPYAKAVFPGWLAAAGWNDVCAGPHPAEEYALPPDPLQLPAPLPPLRPPPVALPPPKRRRTGVKSAVKFRVKPEALEPSKPSEPSEPSEPEPRSESDHTLLDRLPLLAAAADNDDDDCKTCKNDEETGLFTVGAPTPPLTHQLNLSPFRH